MNNITSLINILATKVIQENPDLSKSPLSQIGDSLSFSSPLQITSALLSLSIDNNTDSLPTDDEIQQNLDKIVGAKSCEPPMVLKFRYLRDAEGNTIRPPGAWDTNEDGVVDDLDYANITSQESLLLYDANKDGVVDILDASEITAGNAPLEPYTYNGFIIEGYCDGDCADPTLQKNPSTGKCDCRKDEELPGPGHWTPRKEQCWHGGTFITWDCLEPWGTVTKEVDGKIVKSCECTLRPRNNYHYDPETCTPVCNNPREVYDSLQQACVCSHVVCRLSYFVDNEKKYVDDPNDMRTPIEGENCECTCRDPLVPVETIVTTNIGNKYLRIFCECPPQECKNGKKPIYDPKTKTCNCNCDNNITNYGQRVKEPRIDPVTGITWCCLVDDRVCQDSSVQKVSMSDIGYNGGPCDDCKCNIECPSNSKPVKRFDVKKGYICECVCNEYPEECSLPYLRTDPFGKVTVMLSPTGKDLLPCEGQIPVSPHEFTGPPCSCLCPGITPASQCGNELSYGTGILGKPGTVIDGGYNGKIDPRTCDCEIVCYDECESDNDNKPSGCKNPFQCCNYGKCDHICSDGGRCCPERIDYNKTIVKCCPPGQCCEYFDNSGNPAPGDEPIQSFAEARCVPCSGSYSNQSNLNSNSFSYNIQTTIELL